MRVDMPGAGPPAQLKGARVTSPAVLVVEDEALLLFVAADDLRDAGFTVFEAGNAAEALRLFDAHPGIIALFTDVDMPGAMNGLALCALIHARRPEVRILITSGKSIPAATTLPPGAMFLPKPYAATAVVTALQRMLG